MPELTSLQSRVVLDPSATRVLLAMAYQEGLLVEDADNDQCLKQLGSKVYPDWLKVQALEQVVLFDQIHMALRFAWRGVSGDLFEAGQFYSLPEPRNSDGSAEAIDPAILNGILKARGISPTPFEDPSIMEKVNESLHLLAQWEKKHGEAPSRMSLFFERIHNKSRTLAPEYVELEEIRKPLEDFQPIAGALEEYLSTVSEATDRLAYAMSPVYAPNDDLLFQPKIGQVNTNTPTALLKLTSAKLGVLPFGQSLKETLKIARDPATIALRHKIQEWTDSLTNDSASDTERIQKEIALALASLEGASVGGKVSNITTYLGIPVGLVSLVSQFASAVGWICTLAGTVGLATSDASKHKYRWATFGSSR